VQLFITTLANFNNTNNNILQDGEVADLWQGGIFSSIFLGSVSHNAKMESVVKIKHSTFTYLKQHNFARK